MITSTHIKKRRPKEDEIVWVFGRKKKSIKMDAYLAQRIVFSPTNLDAFFEKSTCDMIVDVSHWSPLTDFKKLAEKA